MTAEGSGAPEPSCVTAWLVGLAAAGWVLWRLRVTVLVLLLSTVLTVLLGPVADRVSAGARGRREVGAAGAVGGLAVCVVLVARWMVRPLARELSHLAAAAPVYLRLAAERLAWLEASLSPLGGDQGLLRVASTAALGAVERALEKSVSLGGHAYGILLVPVLTFFFLKDGPQLGQAMVGALPEAWRERVWRAFAAAAWALRRSVLGLAYIAAVTWGLVWAGLTALKVPNALGWSALVAVAETVPYLGPLFALLTVGVASFAQDTRTGLAVVTLLLAVRALEDAVVGPLVLRSLLRVHGVLLVCSILVGIELFGAAGAFLAAPVATAAAAFVRSTRPVGRDVTVP